MISFKQHGDFSKFEYFLQKHVGHLRMRNLERYGQMGVDALMTATPKDTGKTAASWSYEITRTKDTVKIAWKNDNLNNGVSVAILLQYGHATRDGGYVEGIDYINPAMEPIFQKFADEAWKEVFKG